MNYGKQLFRNSSITINNLRVRSALIPDLVLAADLGLLLKDGQIQKDQSYFRRYEPNSDRPIPMPLDNLHIDGTCMAIAWKETNLNYWLRGLAPDFFEDSPRADTDLTLRVLLSDDGSRRLKEIRLDWSAGTERQLTLPGLTVRPSVCRSTFQPTHFRAATGT